MKDVVEIRIDDRLIHGQVAGLWTNTLNATRIMVIDDEVSADQAHKQLLRMVAPSTVKTSIITEDKAFNNLKDNRYQGQRVFILVKTPLVIKRLFDKGLEISRINLGNISQKDGRVQFRPGISLSIEESNALKSMIEKGIKVTTKKIPTDPEVIIRTEEL